MLYQGIIGGGSSPVEPEDLSPVLLWENPSIGQSGVSFEPQTISLELTNYNKVIIELGLADTNQTLTRILVGRNDRKGDFGSGFVTGDTHAPGGRGPITIDDDGVTFGAGYFSTASPNNTTLIPLRIYGVKEYVVEPIGQLKNVTEVYDLSVSGNGTTKTFTATKKGSYLVQGPGYSADNVTLTTTGETLFNVSQGWFIINLDVNETITCKSLSSGSYTCNVYLLE